MNPGTSILVAVFFLLALAGCASPGGPPFELQSATPGKARIYAFRTASIVGGANSDLVAVNGRFIGRLDSGTYSVYEIEPGPVSVTRKAGSIFFGEGEGSGWGLGAFIGAIDGYVEVVQFEAQAGQLYFVRFSHGELVPETEAVPLMDRLEDVTPGESQ